MSHMKERLEDLAIEVSTEYPHHDTAFFIYLDNHHIELDENWRENFTEFEESYAGQFDSRTDFVDSILEDVLGISEANSVRDNEIKFLITYFDREKYGRDLMHDYWERDGHYFRSY